MDPLGLSRDDPWFHYKVRRTKVMVFGKVRALIGCQQALLNK